MIRKRRDAAKVRRETFRDRGSGRRDCQFILIVFPSTREQNGLGPQSPLFRFPGLRRFRVRIVPAQALRDQPAELRRLPVFREHRPLVLNGRLPDVPNSDGLPQAGRDNPLIKSVRKSAIGLGGNVFRTSRMSFCLRLFQASLRQHKSRVIFFAIQFFPHPGEKNQSFLNDRFLGRHSGLEQSGNDGRNRNEAGIGRSGSLIFGNRFLQVSDRIGNHLLLPRITGPVLRQGGDRRVRSFRGARVLRGEKNSQPPENRQAKKCADSEFQHRLNLRKLTAWQSARRLRVSRQRQCNPLPQIILLRKTDVNRAASTTTRIAKSFLLI